MRILKYTFISKMWKVCRHLFLKMLSVQRNSVWFQIFKALEIQNWGCIQITKQTSYFNIANLFLLLEATWHVSNLFNTFQLKREFSKIISFINTNNGL